ncbi:uncharacterized protein TNCV_2523601 [Trichonephila clavipes]|nr:uncharacterized protein TNCV_2523601 [Trichonephila clavipes]
MPKARSKVSRKRKFNGNSFIKLAPNSNNTSASEAKLSTFESFDVPEPEFHGSTGNIIINFQALIGIISILCCPECYATGLKLAADSNTLLVFGFRLIDRGFTAGKKLLCTLNFPCISKNTIRAYKLKLLEALQLFSEENMKAASKEVQNLKKKLLTATAIRSNVGCLEEMQSAVVAAFFHCCSSNQNPMHGQCLTGKDSWCKYKQALCDGIGIDPTTLKNYMGIDTENLKIETPVTTLNKTLQK